MLSPLQSYIQNINQIFSWFYYIGVLNENISQTTEKTTELYCHMFRQWDLKHGIQKGQLWKLTLDTYDNLECVGPQMLGVSGFQKTILYSTCIYLYIQTITFLPLNTLMWGFCSTEEAILIQWVGPQVKKSGDVYLCVW